MDVLLACTNWALLGRLENEHDHERDVIRVPAQGMQDMRCVTNQKGKDWFIGASMSEIAKCPHCGDYPGILVDMFDKHGKYPQGYRCCGAEFTTLEGWEQYAAAMELAKAWKKFDDNGQDYAMGGQLTDATMHVLEVFK